MVPVRSAISILLAILVVTGSAAAQTFPITAGTIEIQTGIAGVVLPEAQDGTYSAQPEIRVGYFVADAFQVQAEGHARIWPLGNRAPKSFGGGAGLLWFPNLGPQSRNMYIMAGAAFDRVDYPPRYDVTSSLDPIVRLGGGFKVPLDDLGVPYISRGHVTFEYRGEWVALDEAVVTPLEQSRWDFQSGIAIGYSTFR